MRPLAFAALLAAVLVLTGCVSTGAYDPEVPSPVSTPIATPTAVAVDPPPDDACAVMSETLSANVERSLEVVAEAAPELGDAASVALFTRGAGSCAPAASQPAYLSVGCSPAIAPADDAMGPLFPFPFDHMFAAGADRQLSASLSGRDAKGDVFAYGMSAWRFGTAAEAERAPLVEAVAACDGAVTEMLGGLPASTVFEGDEPHLRVVVDGSLVYLYRSVLIAGSDDAIGGLRTTGSGMLSAASMANLDEWWREYAPVTVASAQ